MQNDTVKSCLVVATRSSILKLSVHFRLNSGADNERYHRCRLLDSIGNEFLRNGGSY